MSEYGIPGVRDKDGDLQAVEHSYEWNGDEITIKLIPPTVSQYEEYEQLGREAGSDELRGVVDEHLIKPEIPEDASLTMPELLAYVEGIVDYSAGGGDKMSEQVREELQERGGEPGN